jgi:predicted peptidase
MKKRHSIIALATLAAVLALLFASMRIQPGIKAEYDPAYWPVKHLKTGEWDWCLTPGGINYSLYLPEEADRDGSGIRVPLVVVFHGSTEKGLAKDKYGRLFTTREMQKKLGPHGAAVLAVQSRVEYFSDPHAYARLIRNVGLQHQCIDPGRVAGYGFSQGAAFVQELAMYDPSLFRAVMSGSSYYSASITELWKAARVRFWCATSRDDKGIYEQGYMTGKILAMICPDSRYVEYGTRRHFFVEMQDKSGKETENAGDWLAQALAE